MSIISALLAKRKIRNAYRSRDGKTFSPLDQYPRIDGRLPNGERKRKSNFPFRSMRQVIFCTLLFSKFRQPRSYKIKQFLYIPQLASITEWKNLENWQDQFGKMMNKRTSEVPNISSLGIDTWLNSVATTRSSFPPNCTLSTRKFVPPRSNA